MLSATTILLHSNNKPVKLHLVSTGFVSVKWKFRENKHSGLIAMLSYLFSKNFTEWLPIFIMIVEHPEGVFIIDAGEIADVNDKNYFRSSGI
ncbi:MAG TPA: hypothetical protein VHB70_01780, partial [Parafilimonas sp.]|nr:hypothetical protein [Parafilimonas sp.]